VLAEKGEGVRLQAGWVLTWGLPMTILARLFVDRSGMSSTRLALLIGLSCSAVLVLVRVGAAAATMPGFGH
jgi:hypothetical protein